MSWMFIVVNHPLFICIHMYIIYTYIIYTYIYVYIYIYIYIYNDIFELSCVVTVLHRFYVTFDENIFGHGKTTKQVQVLEIFSNTWSYFVVLLTIGTKKLLSQQQHPIFSIDIKE